MNSPNAASIPGTSPIPLVTVVVLTYNHERFIRQAIESVLAQKTTFPVEILVGEDCSTDRTREILTELAEENPRRLTLLFRDANLGLSANLQDCREKAIGRYLAILEGDDYWIDSGKLQKTADAMESHPDWSMIYHSARIFSDDGLVRDLISPEIPPVAPLGVTEILRKNHVPTQSVAMFRQGLIEQTPDWHDQLRNGDWALYVLHADRGPIGFLPDVMTAYRFHQGGLWSGSMSFDRWQQTILLFDCFDEYFQGRYAEQINDSRNRLLDQLRQRVADLEKIEHRYLALKLDRVASVFKWIRRFWK